MTFVLFKNILTAHICEMKKSAGVALIGYLWHPRLFSFFDFLMLWIIKCCACYVKISFEFYANGLN
jgi:hypothetical protein